jgi:hypothetical protein
VRVARKNKGVSTRDQRGGTSNQSLDVAAKSLGNLHSRDLEKTRILPTNLRSTLSPPQSRPLLTHSPCGLHHELPRRLVWLFRVGTLLHPPFPFVFRDLKHLKAFMPHVLHLEFDRRPHRNMTPYATSMTPSPSRTPSSVVGPRTFFPPRYMRFC